MLLRSVQLLHKQSGGGVSTIRFVSIVHEGVRLRNARIKRRTSEMKPAQSRRSVRCQDNVRLILHEFRKTKENKEKGPNSDLYHPFPHTNYNIFQQSVTQWSPSINYNKEKGQFSQEIHSQKPDLAQFSDLKCLNTSQEINKSHYMKCRGVH